jgi:hypothetical protein
MEVSQLLRDRGYAPETAARLFGLVNGALASHQGLDLPPRPSIYPKHANQAIRFRQAVAG